MGSSSVVASLRIWSCWRSSRARPNSDDEANAALADAESVTFCDFAAIAGVLSRPGRSAQHALTTSGQQCQSDVGAKLVGELDRLGHGGLLGEGDDHRLAPRRIPQHRVDLDGLLTDRAGLHDVGQARWPNGGTELHDRRAARRR